MRRRARHWRTRQCQFFQQSARRSCGGCQLLEGATRRDLHLYGRTPELDRAWTRAGGTAEGCQAQSKEEAGGDLIIPLFLAGRSAGRFIILRTGGQPFFLGSLQGACRTGPRLAELGSLLRVAREQIRQRQCRIDLGDDAVDARDLGLGLGNLLLQRYALFAPAALRPVAAVAALVAAAVARIRAH